MRKSDSPDQFLQLSKINKQKDFYKVTTHLDIRMRSKFFNGEAQNPVEYDEKHEIFFIETETCNG
jgi:hypothetical protein